MYIQLIKLETLFRNGEDKMMKKLLSMICVYMSIENCATFQLKIAPLKRDVIHHFTLNRHPLFY